jgi:type I restriction enzyme, S subunit
LHYEQYADGTVKCIEDEIPFDVPDGWAWGKINTIAFVTKLAGFEYTKNIAPNLCENGIPLLKGKNVQNSTIIYEFESYIPESVSDELQRSQITRKCILTPYVGTIGNIGIHNRPGKYHLGSNVGKIELYNSNSTLIEEYVVAYLQSKYGYQQLTKHMKATAQASISIEAIRDVYLPIPPASEQHKICDILSHTLELIKYIETSKNDINEQITSTKSKILDLAIRGKLVPQDPNDEPASVLLERIRAEKEELIKQGKIKGDKKESVIFKGDDNSYYEKIDGKVMNIDGEVPFEVPDNWSWCRGYSCFKGIESTKPQGEFFDYIDIDAIDNRLHRIKKPKHLLVSDAPSRANRSVKNGSVLFSLVRPYLENIALIEEKHSHCIASTGFYVCNSNGVFLPEFMFYLMISGYVVGGLNQYMKGDNSPSINKDNIESWLYPIPPIAEQKKIFTKLQTVFAMIESVEKGLN